MRPRFKGPGIFTNYSQHRNGVLDVLEVSAILSIRLANGVRVRGNQDFDQYFVRPAWSEVDYGYRLKISRASRETVRAFMDGLARRSTPGF
jgi:hypothetical protein